MNYHHISTLGALYKKKYQHIDRKIGWVGLGSVQFMRLVYVNVL
jgi:hypothetical protein